MSNAVADVETPETPEAGFPVWNKVFVLMVTGLVFAFALAGAMIFDV